MHCVMFRLFLALLWGAIFMSPALAEDNMSASSEEMSPFYHRIALCEREMPPDEALWIIGDQACLRGRVEDFAVADLTGDKHIRWYVVNSPGGDAGKGLKLGEHIKKNGIDLIVWNQCSSSCANYMFLGADMKVIPKGVRLMWHGSPHRQHDQIVKSIVTGRSVNSVAVLRKALKKNEDVLAAHKAFYAENPKAFDVVSGMDRTLRTQGSALNDIQARFPERFLAGWTPSPQRLSLMFNIPNIVCEMCEFSNETLLAGFEADDNLSHYTLEDLTEFSNPAEEEQAYKRHALFQKDLKQAETGNSESMTRLASHYSSRTHARYDWALARMWALTAREFGQSVPLPKRPPWSERYKESQWVIWENQTVLMSKLWVQAYKAGVFGS